MLTKVVQQSAAVSVIEYRCDAGPHDRPFPEAHAESSLSYVCAGSFGCQVGRERHELVAGSVLIGRAGDEYVCTHDHHAGGDVCLSIRLGAELHRELARGSIPLRSGSLPPTAELSILGELALAAARGANDCGVDEAALMFAARFAQLSAPKRKDTSRISARDRQRAIAAAQFIEAHARDDISLTDSARFVSLTPFHYLRVFSRVLGVSPHQYLVRVRLRNAAQLLAEREQSVTETAYAAGFGDLSNFVRTFSRAAGLTPGAFQRAARGKRADRKILQERLRARR